MTIRLPSGRYLGRRPDSADNRDLHFRAAHPEAARVQLPPAVDLRRPQGPSAQWPKGLPGMGLPCFDQGEEGSCGLNMGSAILMYEYPELAKHGGASRHQLYYDVRQKEGTGSEDAGVETRDVFKIMTEVGGAPEAVWPYVPETFAPKPPPEVYHAASKYKLTKYSRLRSASNYLQCLALGRPFGLGIMLYESFDDEQTDRTGIMPAPKGKKVGGHDVTCVGYVLNFKTDPLFTTSGVAPEHVSDEMLIIRNSWGPKWSSHYRGHFLMPLQYAMDSVNGDDAWTGRR